MSFGLFTSHYFEEETMINIFISIEYLKKKLFDALFPLMLRTTVITDVVGLTGDVQLRWYPQAEWTLH